MSYQPKKWVRGESIRCKVNYVLIVGSKFCYNLNYFDLWASADELHLLASNTEETQAFPTRAYIGKILMYRFNQII